MRKFNNNRELIRSIRDFYLKVKGMESCLENHFLPVTKEETKKTIQLKKKIVSEVEQEFGIPFFQLVISKEKKAIKAKTMLILLFNKHLFFLQKDIANQLNVKQSHVSERISAFSQIMKKLESAKQISRNKLFIGNDFCNIYIKLDKIISSYKTSIYGSKNTKKRRTSLN